jgi:hypothetical protein
MIDDIAVFTQNMPRREWLLRCQDGDLNLAVFSIEANGGTVDIVSPTGEFFSLRQRDIVEFEAAFTAALAQAATDLTTP